MKRYLTVILLLLAPSLAQAAGFDHSGWNSLLERHVKSSEAGHATRVDYRALLKERPALRLYLQRASTVTRESFEQWSRAERLAFLINLYNAHTVELILSAYPLASIRDLRFLFSSPWQKEIVPLFGEMVSLDEIEHGMIRADGAFAEPRIHFAVNCASIGCPALAGEAYTAEKLEDQLESATVHFLSDRSRNRLDGKTVRVSKIFKWYHQDFERGWGGYRSLAQFFARYRNALGLSDIQAGQLINGEIDITFLDYDWSLNESLDN